MNSEHDHMRICAKCGKDIGRCEGYIIADGLPYHVKCGLTLFEPSPKKTKKTKKLWDLFRKGIRRGGRNEHK